jgi:Rha family phage regulatory protein
MLTSLPALCERLHLRADGRVPVVNSRDVGKEYGKYHHHVLRDLKILIDQKPDLVAAGWFRSAPYLGENGKLEPSYDLTRDGFTLLVQGWIGPKALDFRIQYIHAFNAMEHLLQSRPDITSHAEFMEAIRELVRPLAIRFDAQDTAINRVETKVDAFDLKLDQLGHKVEAIDERMNRKRRANAKKHEPVLIYICQRFYGGRCPVSGVQLLDQAGRRIPGASEIDHYYETGREDIGNFWLVATHINQGLGHGIIPRDTTDPHFKGFQEKIRQTTGVVLKLPERKHAQPTLFG